MKFPIVSFDVDGTLSAAGSGLELPVIDRIARLERSGVQIVLNSGKNAPYLAGLARGASLRDAWVIGENGCVLFHPATLQEIRLSTRHDKLDAIEREVRSHFGDRIWIQPNQVALTVFPVHRPDVPQIGSFIKARLHDATSDYTVFEHIDAVDVLPVEANKGRALRHLAAMLSVEPARIAAIGDSHNDIPMFHAAGLRIVVGGRIEVEDGIYVQTVVEAMDYIAKLEGVPE